MCRKTNRTIRDMTLTHISALVCVTDNITNMSQVASVEMDYHLFHRGPAH